MKSTESRNTSKTSCLGTARKLRRRTLLQRRTPTLKSCLWKKLRVPQKLGHSNLRRTSRTTIKFLRIRPSHRPLWPLQMWSTSSLRQNQQLRQKNLRSKTSSWKSPHLQKLWFVNSPSKNKARLPPPNCRKNRNSQSLPTNCEPMRIFRLLSVRRLTSWSRIQFNLSLLST